jgi:PhzF family phenazine biosynthesis protein
VEVDLCGHATLATAHIIFTEISPTKEEISFETKKAGKLTVTRQKKNSLYTLNFPARPANKADLPDGMLSALRSEVTPIGVYKARDYLLVYENEADVKQLSPDYMALSKIDAVFAVIVTAPGDQVDFVSRFFAPSAGVPEDPVCGSAHCTLTPYWAERLGKNQLHAYQISARKGELWCEKKDDRVLLSGKAVTYLKGEINI